MVVGNGMIAHAFSEFREDENIIIYASGVSNSGETDQNKFQREFDLIKSFADTSKSFVYFSTVSIHDPELKNSAYVKHKMMLEEFITNSFSSFLILRLPIVVGKTSNPNTLTNFIYNKLVSGEPIMVFKNACRYLMDIDDIKFLCSGLIRSRIYRNEILDVNFENAMKSAELISIFENVMHIKAKKILTDRGGCYSTENDKFLSYLTKIDFNITDRYTEKILRKYYSAI